MIRHLPLLVILLAFVLVGGLFAVETPAWQAPDEPAHYNFIRQLSEGQWPVIEQGDYDQAYQSEVISSGFDPQYDLAPFEYEDHQPPLYYLLLTPIYEIFDGQLRALRLASVLLGVAVVTLTYMIAEVIFPGRRWLSLTAAVFVALLPQHVAMLSAVNNDSLAELWIALTLLLVLKLVYEEPRGSQDRRLFTLGVVIGMGLLTKATVYLTVPVVGLALVIRYRGDTAALVRRALLVFGPALLLGSILWIRNVTVYGGLDVLGLGAHDAVVIGQPRTSDWIADRGLLDTSGAFIRTTFQSFWGQFGWMAVPMPVWVYGPLLLFSLLTMGGLVLVVVNRRMTSRDSQATGSGQALHEGDARSAALILATTFILSVLAYVGYNVTFVQHQGRYLFPSLVAIAAGVALSWSVILRPLTARWPKSAYLLPAGLGLALFVLDLVALYRFIVPTLG